jgi:hypothetical protein
MGLFRFGRKRADANEKSKVIRSSELKGQTGNVNVGPSLESVQAN